MAPKSLPKAKAPVAQKQQKPAAQKPVEKKAQPAKSQLKRKIEEPEEAEEEASGEEIEGEDDGEDDEEEDDDSWTFSGDEEEEEEGEGEEEGEEEEKGQKKKKIAKGGEDDEFENQSMVISLDPETHDKLMTKVTKVKDEFVKSKRGEVTPGVIYLGRVPHGFFEEEMKRFFRQFGQVTRLRLSRNKKTGKSRHYAFIEFEFAEVAAIVAETMNNYLMFGSLMKSQVVPAEKIHPKMFMDAKKRLNPVNYKKREINRRSKKQTTAQYNKTVKSLVANDAKKRQKLQEAGIEYDFPGYAASAPAKSTRQSFDD